MTDHPYSNADLRAEAAKQHKNLTEDFDYTGVGERMGDNKPWGTLGDVDFDTARDAIGDLITNAADVSAWAIRLGAAGLKPLTDIGVAVTTGGYAMAAQIAIDPELTDNAQQELVRELNKAITETASRVLGLKPVTP